MKFTWSLMLQVLVSPGPRFEARVKNATVAPSPLIAGSMLTSLDCPPVLLTLTRTSCTPRVRPGGGRLAAVGPPPWSRSSRMAIAFACAGKDLRLT